MKALRQDISLKQTLSLNQQTRTWLEIISMPALGLKEKVERELNENPFLEVSKSGSSHLKSIDNIMEETIADKSKTLFSHLEEQINIILKNKKDISIALQIITFINKDGYLDKDITSISNIVGESISKVESILKVIKTFDPVGIASSTIEECLIIQLKSLDYNNTIKLSIELVKNYLEDIAKKKYNEIMLSLNCSKEELEKAISLIKTLEPYPAREFDTTEAKYIIPEIFIHKQNGEWTVKVDNSYIPPLQISREYSKLTDGAVDKKANSYIKENVSKALYLINAIEERKVNLLNIGNALLKLQYSFFEFGKEYLKPLKLKDLVDYEGINLSISSVSRLSNAKYVDTPFGIFAIKYFFSYAVNDYLGSVAVKEIIRHIILDSKTKLSDEKISLILRERGIDLSRRTVNKYRNAMNILSSRYRE